MTHDEYLNETHVHKCISFRLQGGYDGTHFLANVEVYDPVKDAWEDGVPLTSGRSGLASAVIYQPSMPGSYTQDCLSNLPRSREYDDKGGADNHEDETDFMSRGNGSSYHVNLPSNFYRGSSGGSMQDNETTADEHIKSLRSELLKLLKNSMRVLNEKSKLCEDASSDCQIGNMPMKTCATNNSNSTCSLQRIRRHIKCLISTRKSKHHKHPRSD